MALLRRVAFCSLLAIGCGDPIAGVDYSGQPLLSFEGQVRFIRDEPPSGAPLRLSIFWSPAGETAAPIASLIEDRAVSVGVTFPSTFKVNVFRPPEPSWLVPGRGFGVASIVVYEQPGDDGHFDPSASRVLGGSYDNAVLYVDEPLTPETSPTDFFIDPGMYLITLPQPCGTSLEFLPGTEDCGVPLGAACTTDAQCGVLGDCLQEAFDEPFPGGYCAVPEDAGCDPIDGALIYVDDDPGFFFKSCADNNDCRTDDGYECEASLKVCTPVLPVFLDLAPDFLPDPFCAVFEEEI